MTIVRLAELAETFGLGLVGDADTVLSGVCSLKPGKPGALSFCSDASLRAALTTTAASAVIVMARDVECLEAGGRSGLVAADPLLAFAKIAALFDSDQTFSPGVHPTASIDASAEVGPGCSIGAGAVIGAGVRVGPDGFIGPLCVIERGAVIGAAARLVSRVYVGARCRLGDRVHIQPGAVLGGRGFGLARARDGWIEVPQLGGVIIGSDVEIGANTCIDRGALDDTVIEDGVKLDNQIQIGHNCRIGSQTAVAACVGIAGSTSIGRRCLIGGAVGISGHLEIVDDVVLLAGTMVSRSILQKGAYGSTMTALPVRDWRKMVARFRRWGLVENRLRAIERHLRISEKESLTEGYGIDGGKVEQDDG